MAKELNMNVSDDNVALPEHVANGNAYKMADTNEIVIGTAIVYDKTRISIDPGEDYKLPKGFYSDDNIITVKSIANATFGDAKAEDIAKNKIAWVNGKKIVGTAAGFSSNLKKSTATLEDIKQGKMAYDSDGNQIDGGVRVFDRSNHSHHGIIIPYPSRPGKVNDGPLKDRSAAVYTPEYIYKGWTTGVELHNGFYDGCIISLPDFGNLTVKPEDVVTGKLFFGKRSVPNETDVYEIYEAAGTLDINEKVKEKIKADGTTVTAADMLSTKKGYDKDGNLVSGTITDVTNKNNIVIGDSNPSYTIPKGYHDGTGKVVYNPSTTETTTATSSDILYGKTALSSNGDLMTGTIDVRDNADIWMHDVSYSAYNTYFRRLEIHNYAQEQLNQISDISDEHIPSGEKYIGRDSSIKIGTMPIITAKNTSISGTPGTYTIPKGYHDGKGKVLIELKKDLPNPDSYKSISAEHIPADVAFFDNSGKSKPGKLRLASYDPIYTYKTWNWEYDYNYSFTLSDDPTNHRIISFNNREDTNFKNNLIQVRGSVIERDEESERILSQYNIDNNEGWYTVLAIPTPLHLWKNIRNVQKPNEPAKDIIHAKDKYFGNMLDMLTPSDDVISEDKRTETFNLSNPMANNWFSKFLFKNRRNSGSVIIDDITVDFNRSDIKLLQRYADQSSVSDNLLKGMDTNHINIPNFRISFPYIPEEYPTNDYLKKCCNSTRVLFDSMDYNNTDDYGNYKIYGVCTPIRKFAYPYNKSMSSDTYYNRFYGGSFAITFHVYNKKKNNYTYERDPEFKDDYVMNQLGFFNTYTQCRLIPIDIKINGIHVPVV